MKKTDLMPSPRLIGRCCPTDYVSSRVTLLLLIFMLPLVSIAQERNSQEYIKAKEANHQEYLQSIYGNQRDVMQISEGKTKVKQLTEAQKQLQLQQLENQNLRAKLENAGVNVQKHLDAGYTLRQVFDELDNPTVTPITNVRGSSSSAILSRATACADAELLSCDSPITDNTYGITTNTGPVTPCGTGYTAGYGVWYTFTGNGFPNTITVTSGTAGFTPQIRVFNGTCGALSCITPSGGSQSGTTVTFMAPYEDTFYVFLSGFSNTTGLFTISRISEGDCIDGPTGDGLSSETAFVAECGNVYTGDTTDFGNTEVGRVDCSSNYSTGSVGVWYKINVTANYPSGTGVTLDLCGSGFDTEVNVYQGADLDCVGYNDDSYSNCGSGGHSYFEFDAQPDTDYYVYIAGYSSTSNGTGLYEMSVECDGIAPPPPPQVPDNDECPDSIDVVCGETYFGNTTLATGIGNPGVCSWPNTTIYTSNAGVWYKYNGDAGYITLSLCGADTNFDTKLGVYEGSCSSLQCVASNDDSCGIYSEVSFTALQDTDYYILVAGYGSSTGNYELLVTCDLPPTIPDNDLCENAEPLVCGETYEGSTLLATNTGAPTEDCSEYNQTIGAGVWYTYEGDGQVVTLSLCDSPLDTKVLVLTGECGALSCYAGNDDECGLSGFRSEVTFSTVIGETYYVYVTGYGGDTGEYTMEVTCQADPCLDATLISCSDSPVYGDNIGGSTLSPEYCGTTAYAPGVFYEIIGEDKFININTCGSALNTSLNVYSGSCGALECLTGNGDWSESSTECGESGKSNVTFYANQGESYFIWVSGYLGEEDAFVLNVSCLDAVENDLCGGAIALECDTTVTGSTILSTDKDKPESDCDGEYGTTNGAGVWYTITGTGGEIIASTCSENSYDTKIVVLTGECGDLTCYAGNDDGLGCPNFSSEVQFSTEVGVTYYIYITGWTGFGGTSEAPTGDFELSIDCLCAPSQEGPECVTIYDGYDDPDYSTATLTSVLEYANEPVSYLWSTGETTESITVEAGDGSQNYSVTMTDADGCSGTQEFFVYVMNVNCDTRGTDKVEICHNGVTICVSPSAVQSHLDHGDVLGACGNGLCDAIAPLCDITINSPANGATGVSNVPVIEWTEASGLVDGYTVSIVDAGAVEVVNADVGNVLSYEVTIQLDYLADYTVSVTPYNSNGSALGCNVNSFTTMAEPTLVYCTSSSDADDDEWISRVELNTIDNSSGQDGYSDYTAISTDLVIGSSYTITITPDFGGSSWNEAYAVWIDYNQDGDFYDTNEQVLLISPTSSSVSGSFTVPAGVFLGATRMRVIQDWNGLDFGQPCIDGYSFGETEDYTVNIVASGARPAVNTVTNTNPVDWSMAPNPTKGNVTLDLTNYLQSDVTIDVMSVTGKVVYTASLQNLKGSKYDVELNNSLPAGMYFVRVESSGQVSTKKLMIMR